MKKPFPICPVNDGPISFGLRSTIQSMVSFIGLLFAVKITRPFSAYRNRHVWPIATRYASQGVLTGPNAYTGSQGLAIALQSLAGFLDIMIQARFCVNP